MVKGAGIYRPWVGCIYMGIGAWLASFTWGLAFLVLFGLPQSSSDDSYAFLAFFVYLVGVFWDLEGQQQ